MNSWRKGLCNKRNKTIQEKKAQSYVCCNPPPPPPEKRREKNPFTSDISDTFFFHTHNNKRRRRRREGPLFLLPYIFYMRDRKFQVTLCAIEFYNPGAAHCIDVPITHSTASQTRNKVIRPPPLPRAIQPQPKGMKKGRKKKSILHRRL